MDGAVLLAIGGGIAATVAIIKSALPDVPARVLPLWVLAVSTVFVAVAAYSGQLGGTPFDLLIQVVSQTATAIGLREGLTVVAPAMKSLPRRV